MNMKRAQMSACLSKKKKKKKVRGRGCDVTELVPQGVVARVGPQGRLKVIDGQAEQIAGRVQRTCQHVGEHSLQIF
jgi:hypothetical protein